MRKTWAIARTVFRLLFRVGTGWGILAAVAGTAALIFYSSNADGVLLNELQLRIRYSSYFFAGLLSFCMLFLSCVSLRGDIEAKRMHNLTASPISRYQIFFGKWLGLLLYAAMIFAVGSLVVAVSAWHFTQNWVKNHPNDRLPERFWRSYHLVEPARPSLREKVDRLYQKRLREAKLPANTPEWQIRQDMFKEVRREEQWLPAGESRSWTFDLKKQPKRGQSLRLQYKLYAEAEREAIKGLWLIKSNTGVDQFQRAFKVFPYRVNEMEIPLDVVPEDGKVTLTFQGAPGTPSIIVPRTAGLAILYDDGSMLGNLARTFISTIFYLAIVIAVGLAVSTAFTLPVATFVSAVLLGLALAAGFFQSVASDLLWEKQTLITSLASHIIKVGIWLSQGLQPPPVLAQFSEGISVRLTQALATWGLPGLLYLLLVAIVGLTLLTRKELDRVH